VRPLAARLHAALPQTQCTRCGYPDCAGYAEAIAAGEAQINQCPPGGAERHRAPRPIADRAALPLNPSNGVEGPRTVAVIDEAWCIGCTLCLDACPTDAILGGNKRMHTVIEPYCTGCELCVPVCPVDCIALENASGERTGWQAWSEADARLALQRYEARKLRKAQEAQDPRRAHGTEGAGQAGRPRPRRRTTPRARSTRARRRSSRRRWRAPRAKRGGA
jgi:electron transport complex protein RnfB